jgi:acyl-CoA thioesterase FadM
MKPSNDFVATEYVAAWKPFTVRRTVRWAECDPAGVVYAGNFTEYMLATAHLFRQVVLGRPVGQRDGNAQYGTPGKALSMVFHSPLWPGDVFDMAVYLGPVGTRTTDILVHAFRVDTGTNVFVGRTTSIYVAAHDRLGAIDVPDDVKAAFEDYRRETGPQPEILSQVARQRGA